MRPRILYWLGGSVALGAVVVGCFHNYTRVRVESVSAAADTVRVRTPVKAHLVDGSIISFSQGALIGSDSLRGFGTRFGLSRQDSARVAGVTMDSVVGIEAFYTDRDVGQSVAMSTVSTIGVVALAIGTALAIACAADPKCFGSCPTFYAVEGDTNYVLEAEGFSYSIVPLFEARDVDRLGARPDSTGAVRLELRNEALETHFLNHLELLEATHPTGTLVFPDQRGRPLAVKDVRAPAVARDRGGRDVHASLQRIDGLAFASTNERLASVTTTDFEDHIDLVFPRPSEADSVALVLRMRNSLLNTVLFYDQMLGAPGARAIDWMADELGSIGNAVAFGRWYRSRMGMRIAVWDGTEWRADWRVPDAGPIAWKDLAVTLPNIGIDSIRVRLSFVADQWRIDYAGLATSISRPPVRAIPVTDIRGREGQPEAEALAAVAAADEDYLETRAGQFATLRFDVGVGQEGRSRTFLLASQGYYTEWIRPSWIRGATTTETFSPSDESLIRAIERYRDLRETFERRFHETRIPVR